MGIRALVDSVLINEDRLVAMIPRDRWYENTAITTPPPRPFAAYRWGDVARGVTRNRRTGTSSLNLYIHDDPGDYTRINEILTIAWEVLMLSPGTVGFGSSIMGVEWSGGGPDGIDEGFRTAVRYETFRITGTGI